MINPNVFSQINPNVENDFFIKKYSKGQKNSSFTTSLKCGITRERINMPVRGINCDSHDAFEFTNLLATIDPNTSTEIQCPICKKPITLADIKFDPYLMDIIKSVKNEDVEYVQIYPSTGVYYELDSKKEPINITYRNFLKNVQKYYKLRRNFRTKWNLMKTSSDIFVTLENKKNPVIKLSTQCPLNKDRKILIPVKSIHCTHIQCVDLKSFFETSVKKGSYKCPLCPQELREELIMIDKIFYEAVEMVNGLFAQIEFFYDPEVDTILAGNRETRLDMILKAAHPVPDDENDDDDDNDDAYSEDYEWEDYVEGEKLVNFDVIDKLIQELGGPDNKNYVDEYEPYALFPDYVEASNRRMRNDKYKGKFMTPDDYDDDDFIDGFEIPAHELASNDAATIDRNINSKGVKLHTGDDIVFKGMRDDVQLIPPMRVEGGGIETLESKPANSAGQKMPLDPEKIEPLEFEPSELPSLDLDSILQTIMNMKQV
jgi:hypothetical protein